VSAPELLHSLLTSAGPSGHEADPARVWREACAAFGAEVSADRLGSSRARVPGTSGAPTLAVVGHIDEIGLHVSHIDDDGFLLFGEVGGWDAMVLVGQRVRLATREGRVAGVVGRKPIHLMKDDDRRKAPEIKDLHIDIGAKDGDDARSRVRIGDVAVIDVEPLEMPNRRLVSRALDNLDPAARGITVDIPESLPEINVDPAILERVSPRVKSSTFRQRDPARGASRLSRRYRRDRRRYTRSLPDR